MQFRKPTWCETVVVDGVSYTETEGYIVVDKEWGEQERILLEFPMGLTAHELNGKTAFSYGPIVLALDESKGNGDLNRELVLEPSAEKLQRLTEKALLCLEMDAQNGKLLFTDYASSGKEWEREDSKISVWLNVKTQP